jgi:MinD superfamily P-loop ATPase
LFLKPLNVRREAVNVTVPEVDMSKCTGCGKCVNFCKYNALALLKDKLMVFYEICHSCGGCILFCPEKALSKKSREIGTVETGTSGEVTLHTGCLNTGEVSGGPIIKKLSEKLMDEDINIIDCPPGSACIVMESIREADYCVLVAEPTLFGAHNLEMVHELVKLFEKPFGVVLNKCLDGENPSKEFCVRESAEILAEIPYDAELGGLNSNGLVAVRESTRYRELFEGLLDRIVKGAVI